MHFKLFQIFGDLPWINLRNAIGLQEILLFVSLKNVGVEDLETPKMHFGAFA